MSIDPLLERRAEFVAFVARRVRDDVLAEDVVQAAYSRALEHAGELRDERSRVAWFYRSLRNAIIDAARRRAVQARALEELASECDERAETFEATGVCGCVLRVAEALKPEYAEVLLRVDVEGDAVKEFAQAHGLTAGNAGVRLFRAREALRRGLLKACGPCARNGCSDCTC